MLETTIQLKEFNIPGVNVTVDENVANISMENLPLGQEQVCELISLLVEVHEYMEMSEKEENEDNQMKLFDDADGDEQIIQEIVLNEEQEKEPTEFSEIIDNSTAFLYMSEDYSNERISKMEINQALHILRDSIESYLNSVNTNEKETKQQEPIEG